jgi:hypothetical protein
MLNVRLKPFREAQKKGNKGQTAQKYGPELTEESAKVFVMSLQDRKNRKRRR